MMEEKAPVKQETRFEAEKRLTPVFPRLFTAG
jgi:hypothetical protein